MKKEFKLTDEKLAPARKIDAVKHEINKYLARERRKTVTEGVDYWDFEVKFGKNKESAEALHVAEINKAIDAEVKLEAESFYIEIKAIPGHRSAKIKK